MGADKGLEVGAEMRGRRSTFSPSGLPSLGLMEESRGALSLCAYAPAGRILLNFFSEVGVVGAEGMWRRHAQPNCVSPDAPRNSHQSRNPMPKDFIWGSVRGNKEGVRDAGRAFSYHTSLHLSEGEREGRLSGMS